MNTIRFVQNASSYEWRVSTSGIIAWDALAKAVTTFQSKLRPATSSTADTATTLLADAMRFWGSGQVKGTFLTSWHREAGELVVSTRVANRFD